MCSCITKSSFSPQYWTIYTTTYKLLFCRIRMYGLQVLWDCSTLECVGGELHIHLYIMLYYHIYYHSHYHIYYHAGYIYCALLSFLITYIVCTVLMSTISFYSLCIVLAFYTSLSCYNVLNLPVHTLQNHVKPNHTFLQFYVHVFIQ